MKIYYWHNPYDLDYLITDLNRIHKKRYSIWRADNLGCILKKSRSQTTYSITKALDRKNPDKKHVSNVGIWKLTKRPWTGSIVECDRDDLLRYNNERMVQRIMRSIFLNLALDNFIEVSFLHDYRSVMNSGEWWYITLYFLAIIANAVCILQGSFHLQWLSAASSRARVSS